MNRKTTILRIAAMFLIAAMLVSCNGLKKMAQNYRSINYKVSPEVLETKGGKINFTVKGDVPPRYFNRKAVIFCEPVLKYAGGEIKLTPYILKGEKIEGEGTTINYEKGGSFSYSSEIAYKPELNASELFVNLIAFMPKQPVAAGMTAEDAKMMRKAMNFGEVKIADGVITTSLRIEVENEVRKTIEIGEETIEKDANGNINMKAYQGQSDEDLDLLFLAPHGYEKTSIVSESVNIYFAKNIYAYNLDLKWNKKENTADKLVKLDELIRKGWLIKDVVINGWASPEGEETFNDGLSENRAKTAAGVLHERFGKIAKEKDTKVTFRNPKEDLDFKTVGNGPDWNSFPGIVESSTIKDKRPILNVVKSSDPLKREQEIRNMIAIYPELEDAILPPLRRAEIVVNCFEPRKTDSEIARLATSNPSELTEAELLYAATLSDEWNTQYKIYSAAATQFPNSWKAFNNIGYMAIKMGKIDDAITNFTKADNLNKNNGMIINNLGVAYACKKNFADAEKHFLSANKMGVNNNYNLGLIDVYKGDFKGAMTKFSGIKCNYHVGLAHLMSGNNSAAASSLECARKNGATYYLLAVTGARTGNKEVMLNNLKKSIKANGKYKGEAAKDREFIKYFSDPDFQALVK